MTAEPIGQTPGKTELEVWYGSQLEARTRPANFSPPVPTYSETVNYEVAEVGIYFDEYEETGGGLVYQTSFYIPCTTIHTIGVQVWNRFWESQGVDQPQRLAILSTETEVFSSFTSSTTPDFDPLKYVEGFYPNTAITSTGVQAPGLIPTPPVGDTAPTSKETRVWFARPVPQEAIVGVGNVPAGFEIKSVYAACNLPRGNGTTVFKTFGSAAFSRTMAYEARLEPKVILYMRAL